MCQHRFHWNSRRGLAQLFQMVDSTFVHEHVDEDVVRWTLAEGLFDGQGPRVETFLQRRVLQLGVIVTNAGVCQGDQHRLFGQTDAKFTDQRSSEITSLMRLAGDEQTLDDITLALLTLQPDEKLVHGSLVLAHLVSGELGDLLQFLVDMRDGQRFGFEHRALRRSRCLKATAVSLDVLRHSTDLGDQTQISFRFVIGLDLLDGATGTVRDRFDDDRFADAELDAVVLRRHFVHAEIHAVHQIVRREAPNRTKEVRKDTNDFQPSGRLFDQQQGR